MADSKKTAHEQRYRIHFLKAYFTKTKEPTTNIKKYIGKLPAWSVYYGRLNKECFGDRILNLEDHKRLLLKVMRTAREGALSFIYRCIVNCYII